MSIPTPFFIRARSPGGAIYLITSHIMLQNSYYGSMVYGSLSKTFTREEFDILPKDFSCILNGAIVDNPKAHPHPYLVVEKSSGDIFLVLHCIDSATLCVKTAKDDIRSLWRMGQMVRHELKEVEVLPPKFKVEISTEEICKKDLYNFQW